MKSNYCRQESTTGFYHVMVRGINRMNIFGDDKDRQFFLHLLKEYVIKMDVQIHAFCLMDNHVHLLIKAEKEDLSNYMRVILTRYAKFFNKKYNRTGHLFQNRFKSEIIDTEKYFLTVLRYILQNPQKAFICTTENYQWSSIKSYDQKCFVSTTFALSLFSSKEKLYKFLLDKNNEECLDLTLTRDEKNLRNELIMKLILRNVNIQDLRNDSIVSKPRRKFYIAQMRKNGLSVKYISKKTGISTNFIQSISLVKKIGTEN